MMETLRPLYLLFHLIVKTTVWGYSFNHYPFRGQRNWALLTINHVGNEKAQLQGALILSTILSQCFRIAD